MVAQDAIDTPLGLDDQEAAGNRDGNGQFVTFSCNDRHYGVDIMAVREIRSWSPTTELPEQPQGACGVLDIRGEIVQVFDLGQLVGDGRTGVTDGHVVLVVSLESQTIGILVDAVSDIIEVGAEDIRTPPQSGAHAKGVVAGLAKRDETIVTILNIARLLEAEAGI